MNPADALNVTELNPTVPPELWLLVAIIVVLMAGNVYLGWSVQRWQKRAYAAELRSNDLSVAIDISHELIGQLRGRKPLLRPSLSKREQS